MMCALITTAKQNHIDSHARLANVLVGIAGHPACELDGLLLWNWKHSEVPATTAA